MYDIKIEDIIKIAREAGEIAMKFYNRKYSIEEKKDKTPVTDADMAIHLFLIEKLSVYGHPIVSEEGSIDGKDVSYTWVVDPLDGTSDFIQKTGEFSIMIGLINDQGRAVLGVVYAPVLNELYYAQEENGAYCLCHSHEDLSANSAGEDLLRIHVSDKGIESGTILVSRNHLGQKEQDIAKKFNMTQVPMGSAGLKICRIARGDAELYINSSDKSGIWDICAADVILREANGYIINLRNDQIMYDGECFLRNGYIVSNTEVNF